MGLTKLLIESYSEEDIPWGLYDLRDDIMREALIDIAEGVERQPWTTAKFNQIKTLWDQYAKYGYVRNTKLMERISELFIRNILKIDVNTEISGHTPSLPLDKIKSLELVDEYSEAREWYNNHDEQITDYLWDHEQNQLRISDYATEKLGNLAYLLDKAVTKNDHELMLRICDRILNVVHRRSDISKWFVEGGVASLDRLFKD